MKWKTLLKWLNLLKFLVYYKKELVKQFKMMLKNKKGGFLSTLLGTLGASFLGKMLAGKGINRAEEGCIRSGYESTLKKGFLMSS